MLHDHILRDNDMCSKDFDYFFVWLVFVIRFQATTSAVSLTRTPALAKTQLAFLSTHFSKLYKRWKYTLTWSLENKDIFISISTICSNMSSCYSYNGLLRHMWLWRIVLFLSTASWFPYFWLIWKILFFAKRVWTPIRIMQYIAYNS